HQRARDILTEHRLDLENLSQILLRRETIERDEFIALLDGEEEAAVFAERDRKAAELARQTDEQKPSEGKPAKRLPYPGAGEPLPE
ncbi:MAG: cell division protein FtsH, partial [Thermoleophilia bacterium]